jgi:ribosomal protein S18 acetylase RimI-like enzyme
MFSDRSEPGVGHALLRFLETSAREMGYSELWLETRLINHKAVRFYEKMDMSVLKIMVPTGRKEAVCFSKALH